MSVSLYFTEIMPFYIGFVMLAAAWGKTKTYDQFTESLVESFHLSKTMSQFIAPLLIIIEWSIALILITKIINTQWAMLASLILFSLFTCVVIYLLIKYEVVRCNCFGEEQRPISVLDLIRNLMFISSIVFYLLYSQTGIDLSIDTLVLLACVAMIISVISINFHDVFLTLTNQS